MSDAKGNAMPELKPCPWESLHENLGHMEYSYNHGYHFAWCSECECEGPTASTREEARKLWNSWADELERVKRENEALKDQLSKANELIYKLHDRHPRTQPSQFRDPCHCSFCEDWRKVLEKQQEAPE